MRCPLELGFDLPQRLAYLVLSVGIGQFPVLIGHAHPLIFLSKVNDLPTLQSFRIILFGIIRECIEIFIFCCKTIKINTM